jgi:exonuclease VII small subunit
MTTLISILLLVSIALLVFAVWLHFTDRRNTGKPAGENDPKSVEQSSVPEIMGASKGQLATIRDNMRQEKIVMDSSVIFAAETQKEEEPPDPESNPDLSSESFLEIDPLNEKKALSPEELESINAMFSDAVAVNSGNVLEKDIKLLSLTLSDDMFPGEEEKASISDTVERLEGTDLLNDMLQKFRTTKGGQLIEGLREALRDNENKIRNDLSVNKNNKTETTSYEEINLDDYM